MWFFLIIFLSFNVFSKTDSVTSLAINPATNSLAINPATNSLVINSSVINSRTKKKSSEIPDRREFLINKSVNPCHDFYQYTCSKAIDLFQLREDRSSHIFSFSDSSERLLETKKTYLKNLTKQSKKTGAKKTGAKKTRGEQELSDIFLACINTDQRADDEKAFVEKTKKQLESLMTREEFNKFLGKRILTPKYSFFGFGDIVNQDSTNKNDIYISTNLRGLPEKSYYKDKKVLKAYKNLIESFFKTLDYKDYKKRAEWVVNFEVAFDETYPTPQEWRSIWTQRKYISRKRLLNEYAVFHLDDFLLKIPKKTIIRHFIPKTYDFMKAALEKENIEKLKSIFLYHALSPKMDEGYKEFFKKKFAFRKDHMGGSKKRSDLIERCTFHVMRSFSKELDYELYPKVFGDFSKTKFIALAEKVREALLAELKDNVWLSKKGKKNAIKKMKTATLKVVKPNNTREWDMIEAADYSPKHHLANKELRSQKTIKKILGEIRKGPNKEAWIFGPLTVNAYYSPPTNTFVMPAGILQYPFYDQNLPDHINLGAVGAVVGHELGHGIDDRGSKYDYKGRLRQWMTEKDIKEFQKRSAIMVSQFDEIGHNGTLTLGENIGDLVGLTAAYRAAFPNDKAAIKPEYAEYAANDKTNDKTNDKANDKANDKEASIKKKKEFFIQYGRNWCGVMRSGQRKRLLRIDRHAVIEARVNEQVKHQHAFAKAFNCKPGDKMYLSEEKRVKIW